MKRIGILGLGGVGGYFGGLLAKAYQKSDDVEIIFIARGETQKAIAENGLKIVTDDSEMIVHPNLVSNDPSEIGVLDYLICATKTYDIEESFTSLKSCIKKETLILPLYNGVDAQERIKKILPDNEVLQGCVYIVSMIFSPGTIRRIGFYEKLFFGSKTASFSKMEELQNILQKAKVESYLVENIEETVWEKFIFISALASATSYLNQNIGEILSNSESKVTYIELLHEIEDVAQAKGLKLPHDIVAQSIQKLEKSPKEATSSMHRDLLAGKNTEALSLTQFVVNEGKKYGVKTPLYEKIAAVLVK
ncbi:2-dehydropantoate 2-reductase [Flavobacterium sp. WLB]|uniref:ketopantoate reductase family protein n=1 Tax=unclassified Flavobacterium TaxID=196869 RepID=UPI0006ABB05A|nr:MULTISPECIES: 2-dehydropantoate 2-reductase [unclassified Flavobacterium]KOP39548.1 2-dehydropantoate 2-reductase [Flavobacterium sp. VMW]OWU91838.1 2-dehydropantoate 2-reductase [Flavobacterium sp. NLM]PUU69645.1 2-dehydropantoate 2-reductase [Flavobacterium sp. WLB]